MQSVLGILYSVSQMQNFCILANDSFQSNICSENQKLPRIFFSLMKATYFSMTVPFTDSRYIFRSLSNKFPAYYFLKLSLLHFTQQVKLFFLEKGKLYFRIRKCNIERNQKNYYFRKTLNCF